jgi:hypothetical protein
MGDVCQQWPFLMRVEAPNQVFVTANSLGLRYRTDMPSKRSKHLTSEFETPREGYLDIQHPPLAQYGDSVGSSPILTVAHNARVASGWNPDIT